MPSLITIRFLTREKSQNGQVSTVSHRIGGGRPSQALIGGTSIEGFRGLPFGSSKLRACGCTKMFSACKEDGTIMVRNCMNDRSITASA